MLFGTQIHEKSLFEHPKNHRHFRVQFFAKSLKTTPTWEGFFHALTPFFRPFFLLGALMGSKGPSRLPRRWCSCGLGTVFDRFLMHLGTRLKGKSTVAEQRGCALDTPRQCLPLAAGVTHLVAN